MIGYYNYTVILTYLSLLSAGTGILVSLSGNGHPYWGVFCLLLCGLNSPQLSDGLQDRVRPLHRKARACIHHQECRL